MSQISKAKDSFGRKAMFQRGLQAGFPIILGYIPVAITFGVLAAQSGLSLIQLTMMSALVYAGASQFMGVNMIVAGSAAVEIIVANFVLNFRHFIMSLSFMNDVKETISMKGRIGLSLGLTDEAFAVSSLNQDKAKGKYAVYFYTAIYLTGYLTWVITSFLGGMLGEVIPEQLSQSMGIALYALFIGLLIPPVKKEIKYGLISITSMLINTRITQVINRGWAIVCGTLLGGFTGVFLLKEKT